MGTREEIVNMEFGNWKGPWVISFSSLVKQMRNLRPTDGNSVILVLILLGTVGEKKHLLFNRYRELFFSCLAEVTQVSEKKFQSGHE